jgi:hypothetical protein
MYVKGEHLMRFEKTLIVCSLIVAFAFMSVANADAQLKRTPALRARPAQRATVTKPTTPATTQNRNLISAKVVQLSPMVVPAVGPSGAQGLGSIFYNDVDTSMNSGNLVVTGLPAGKYYAWLVFFDPFAHRTQPRKQKIHSELVAKFKVLANGDRTETPLMIGLPNVITLSHAKQLVITKKIRTQAQVGGAPICGAAGYQGGPAQGKAILAANFN